MIQLYHNQHRSILTSDLLGIERDPKTKMQISLWLKDLKLIWIYIGVLTHTCHIPSNKNSFKFLFQYAICQKLLLMIFINLEYSF